MRASSKIVRTATSQVANTNSSVGCSRQIEKGQWKGWTTYNEGDMYERTFGKKTIQVRQGHFYVKGKPTRYNTLKEALE